MSIRAGVGRTQFGGSQRHRALPGLLTALAVAVGCGPTPTAETPRAARTAAVVANAPPDVPPAVARPLPELPAGEVAPLEVQEPAVAQVLAADRSGGFQTLLIELSRQDADRIGLSDEATFHARVAGSFTSPVVRAGDEAKALAPATSPAAVRLWVRHEHAAIPSADPVPSQLAIEVYTSAGSTRGAPVRQEGLEVDEQRQFLDVSGRSETEPSPGRHGRVVTSVPSRVNARPTVVAAYLAALGAAEGYNAVGWLLGVNARRHADGREPHGVARDWRDLMRLSTGYESVEAALVTERQLRAPVSPGAAKVPLTQLKPPDLRHHPWQDMLAKLEGPTPTEPLAAMVPAEFYYARARSFAAFQTLLEQIDAFVTPAVRVLQEHRQQLDLTERYRLELALPPDELSKVLGPHLVRSVVVTGSDPLLRQGSDLSLVLEAPSAEALLGVLAAKRAELKMSHGLTSATWTHGSVEVASHTSSDGLVRQEVASFQRPDGKQFVLVSNSKNAARRILDTWLGARPALSGERDFQYMAKRDSAVAEDVLVYMGDRFVAEVVSPRQRILDSRRQVAKAELAAAGYGALLFGTLYGRLPADAKELVAQTWFGPSRLRHASGEPIVYDSLSGIRSPWGTPRRLTSLMDLPAPVRVSKAEQDAYAEFARDYQWQWGERIDPIALRVKVESETLDLHLRVLPVSNSSDYADILRWSGGGETRRAASVPGVAGVLALGEGSPIREFLSGNGRSFLGDQFKLEWLGDWVELGLADDRSIAELTLEHGDLPMPPSARRPAARDNEMEVLGSLPLYLSVDIRSAAGASLMLTALRELATGASPDTVRWGVFKKHAGATIVRVHIEDLSIYYVLTKQRLLVALRPETLEHVLQRLHAEKESEASTNGGASEGDTREPKGQLVVDLAPLAAPSPTRVEGSALRTVASWMLEKGVRTVGTDNPLATLLLHGAFRDDPAPASYAEQAWRWLGAVPVTADGKPYVWTSSGVADPERGNAHHPKWPKLPVASGPVARVLESVLGLRAAITIDEEPGQAETRSLRIMGRVRLGKSN